MLRRFRLLIAVPLTAVLMVGPAPAHADPIVLPDPLGADRLRPPLSCTQLVPHAISATSEPVRLDLRILLDRVAKAEAKRAVTAMRKAYGPLGSGWRRRTRR